MDAWRSVPLTECIERVSTPAKIPRKQFEDSGRFPIVSQEKEFINGYWSDESAVIHVDSPLVVFGDHTQVLKYIDFDFVVGADGVKLLQPKSFLNTKYFYYFLRANPTTELGYARHYRLLKELDIRFPHSLPEQKRIVAILDEAFAGIDTAVANTEKNLANARELFESYLNNVFTQKGEGWSIQTIEDLCTIGDGNHSSKYPKKSEMAPSGVPFIRGTNLVGGKISSSDILFISPEKHQDLKKGHLKTGDVLFTNRGEIGKVAIVDEAFNNANLNSQIAWLRCGENLLPEYLFFFLQSGQAKQHFSQTKSGAALQQFTIKMLKAVEILLPSFPEQKRIMITLNALSVEVTRLETLYQHKLTTLAALKQSLLHKAFSGALTSQSVSVLQEAVA